MTPTREQMELAAKAAGIERSVGGDLWSNARGMLWTPLASGDDSQRLQGKLRIGLLIDGARVLASEGRMSVLGVDFNPAIPDDDLRAMREVIFLVAVKIGRAMK